MIYVLWGNYKNSRESESLVMFYTINRLMTSESSYLLFIYNFAKISNEKGNLFLEMESTRLVIYFIAWTDCSNESLSMWICICFQIIWILYFDAMRSGIKETLGLMYIDYDSCCSIPLYWYLNKWSNCKILGGFTNSNLPSEIQHLSHRSLQELWL